MRILMAVLVAGVVATLIDNFAAARLFGADFMALTQKFGRFGVALGGAALLPLIFGALGPVLGAPAAFLALAGGAAALAKTVFGYAAPIETVLILTSIYAVTAIFIYLAIAGPGPRARA
ncbi:MAG: hypothetical protein AAFW46_11580 [Pseudomonadota bacterium]